MVTHARKAPLPCAETLFNRRSIHQHIELVRETDHSLSLTLDDFWQFSTLDERIFHEALVEPAMRVAPRLTKVLILGGGDGLALRQVLRQNEVERVVLCEIDADVLEMTRTVPEMVELTENSLADPRVEVKVADALAYLPETDEQFDVIICDFPVSGHGRSAPEYDTELCGLLARVLAPDGVVTVQVSQEPPEFWFILSALSEPFPWVEPRLVNMCDGTWADFVLASRTPRQPQRPFPPGLRHITPTSSDEMRILNRSGNVFVRATDQGTDIQRWDENPWNDPVVGGSCASNSRAHARSNVAAEF